MFKTTKSSFLVHQAFNRRGWSLVSDSETGSSTAKLFWQEVWVKDVDESSELRFTVTYNRQGHVTAYSHGRGYAETHGEGRSGGVWRKAFGTKECRELLLDNMRAADKDVHHYASVKKEGATNVS
jgi:hypothetical protein